MPEKVVLKDAARIHEVNQCRVNFCSALTSHTKTFVLLQASLQKRSQSVPRLTSLVVQLPRKHASIHSGAIKRTWRLHRVEDVPEVHDVAKQPIVSTTPRSPWRAGYAQTERTIAPSE